MKAQDYMDQNNNRADAVRRLLSLCEQYGYTCRYTEKRFTIDLPGVEELPVIRISPKRKKEIDLSIFGPDTGYHEGQEDELPPIDTTLPEGRPE